MLEQANATSSIAANSFPSSSEPSSSSALQIEVKDGMESDDEIRRVPEMCGEQNGASASGRYSNSGAETDGANQASGESQKKRGRSPADKGSKRLKRLLRNRVSAQQARERKKAYLVELEARVKDLEKNNSEMEERLSTLQNENQMLRQVGAMKLFKNQAAARFQIALDSARGLDYPFDAVHKLALLARTCTSEESTKRLSMRLVVVALVMLSSATQEWSIDLSFWKS